VHNQYKILNIKRHINLYLEVLRLSHVNCLKTQLLVHFWAKDFLVVCIVHLNASIGNCVVHDLVSRAVKEVKCVLLVVTRFRQLEMLLQNKR
jgi:hypothetical protein